MGALLQLARIRVPPLPLRSRHCHRRQRRRLVDHACQALPSVSEMQILGLEQDHIPLSSTSSSHKSVFFSDHGKAVHCSHECASSEFSSISSHLNSVHKFQYCDRMC